MRATTNWQRRAIGALVTAGCAVMLLGAPATVEAAPLGLVQGDPDISAALSISYDGTTFLATSLTGSGEYKPGLVPISGLTYALSATIDTTGALSGGTFSITGEVPGVTNPGDLLLSGNLTSFGFTFMDGFPDFGLFEFTFDTTSSAAGLGFGSIGGIIITSMDLSRSDVLDFSSRFSGTATSDSFAPVPEPASMLLMGVGVLGAAARRKYQTLRGRA